MNNDIQKWKDINRFQDYKKPEFHTDILTNTSQLSEDEKNIIELSINKIFVNPKFKMKYFVTEAQLTPFHKLKQLFMELKTCEESLENVEFIMKKHPVELEITKLQLEREEDVLKRKHLELRIIEIERDMAQTKRRIEQNYIERHQYLDLIKEFLESDESKTPDGRSLLEVFDTPEEDFYESLYWTTRLAKQAAMDIISYGRIMSGNLDSIVMLPQEQQNEIFAIAHGYSLKMDQHQAAIKNNIAAQIEEEKTSAIAAEPEENRINNDNGDLSDVYRI